MASTSKVVNAIRNDDHTFADIVPEANVGNLLNVGQIINGNKYCRNAFMGAIYNVIALTRFANKYYKNHFGSLKKGRTGYGETVQELFIDRVFAKTYSPNTASVDALKRYIPQIYSKLHHMNVQDLYATSIQEKDIERAFNSEDGVNQLIDKILQRPYDDAEADDEQYIIRTIANAYNSGCIFPVQITDIDSATDKEEAIKDVVVKARSFITKMEYRNNQYNALGVYTHTPLEDLVVIMDADYEANYGVRVLSSAFNMAYAEIPVSIIKIPEFATATGLKMVMCDKDFVQNYEILFELGEPEKNGFGLYTSYPLHKWSIYDVSPFANAIAFTTDTVATPTAISGEFSAEEYLPGDACGLEVTVTGTGVFDQRFTVALSGNTDPTTCYIGGAVYFGKQETANTITATITSLASGSVTGTTTIAKQS